MMNTTGMSAAAEAKLGALSEAKRELLKKLLDRETRENQAIGAIQRKPVTAGTPGPTSWAQQRLWFIDQLEGGTDAYNIAIGVRLRGPLDRDALQKAFDALVERHEILRTVFTTSDDGPLQQVQPAQSLPLQWFDLNDLAPAERDKHVQRHKVAEVHQKFDLGTGPLIRGRLIRLDDQEHVLLVTMHHIVSDGWSIGVWTREFEALYRAFQAGHAPSLPPLQIQYADYTHWQRRWLQGELFDKQMDYWRERLSGDIPPLELPTDRPRPATQSYRGGNVPVTLDADLTRRAKDLAQSLGITLFMLLGGAWGILLSRLAGRREIVIGTPVANRRRREIESLIGFFVNTLVLRMEVEPQASVRTFLEKVKAVTLGAFEHQDLPFEQLVEALQPERSLSRNPLFQVMFALQTSPKADPALAGLQCSWEATVDEPAMFDLLLSLEERGAEVAGSVNFATDIFDRETVERWMSCYRTLLDGMTTDPAARVCDLSILPAAERQLVVETFNATGAPHRTDCLVHELFEEQVLRAPNAPAVSYEGRALTYAELDQCANRLAAYLRAEGVGPDRLVGICLERGIEMVAALLAVLKAGGAYLPLDPNYPAERLEYMIQDAAPRIVLTQASLRHLLPAATASVVDLHAKLEELASAVGEIQAPARLSNPESLLYVIYTSGSTGRPKGTAMPHGAMVNLMEWHRSELPLTVGSRVLQFAALSFDVAFQETFSTLCAGGTLVMIDEWLRKDANALLDFVNRESIERLFIPPLMLQRVAEASRSAHVLPTRLRDVITAGEQLRISNDVARFLGRISGCRLHNHYGPTETHVVTALTLDGNPDTWPALPAIGRPIANTQMYVLDEAGEPAPVGVPGEIYIGGLGLARGYLGRPELTGQRFVQRSISSETAVRLYRTGDVGRWGRDGVLEYMGAMTIR